MCPPILSTCRAPKRTPPTSLAPPKKARLEEDEPARGSLFSFKNTEYFTTKGDQKRKKWKNLKQILEVPITAPEGLEAFKCKGHRFPCAHLP